MTVSAVLFDAVDRPLMLGEVAAAALAPDELRLSIAACGICGSDLHMAHDPETFGITRGAVLGHEFAGIVTEVGSGVTEFGIGARVAVAPIRGCGDCHSCAAGEPAWCAEMSLIGGGYAQSAVVAARQCRIVPEDVAPEDAALAEPAAVALHAVRRAPLRPGSKVLVLGAGPIGLLVAFWARRLGAQEVVVADIVDHQKNRALRIGATQFEMSDDGLADRLDRLGVRPDIVYECVGRRGLINFAVSLVAPRGVVVGVGLCVAPDAWDGFAALHKEVTIAMSAFFNMAEFEVALDALRPSQGARPQEIITDRVGLTETPAAFSELQQKSAACKKLIFCQI